MSLYSDETKKFGRNTVISCGSLSLVSLSEDFRKAIKPFGDQLLTEEFSIFWAATILIATYYAAQFLWRLHIDYVEQEEGATLGLSEKRKSEYERTKKIEELVRCDINAVDGVPRSDGLDEVAKDEISKIIKALADRRQRRESTVDRWLCGAPPLLAIIAAIVGVLKLFWPPQ